MFVNDWIADLAELLYDWYTGLLVTIVQVLLQTAVPTPEELSNDFFSVALGGTFGLAVRLLSLLAVIIALVILLSPNRRHGRKLSRLITSMFYVLLFAALFYPAYSLLYHLSQGATQGVINLATGQPNGTVEMINDLFNGSDQMDIVTKLISSALSGSFAFLALIEVFALRVLLIVVLLFYPIVLALRPLGGLASWAFHAANTSLVLVVVCPPIMGFLFVLPLLAMNQIPGGSFPLFTVVLTIIGSLLALATPVVIALAAFRASSEVFGSIDTAIAGPLTIDQMPPVTIADANRDVQDVHVSPLKMVIADVVGDGMMHGDLFEDMRGTIVNAAASASAVAGHPYIGMALKAGDAVIDKAVAKKAASMTQEGGT